MRLPSEDLTTILSKTAPLWKTVRGGRLFLTGGTGFFGQWLLESFTAAVDEGALDAKVVVLTRSPERFREKAPHLATHPAVELLEGDVTEFDLAAPALEGITLLIHAATTSSEPVPAAQMADTITLGTRRVLQLALARKVKRFLFVSSGAVYGTQPPALAHVGESYLGAPALSPTPLNVYGEAKRMAELLCQIAHAEEGLPVVTARCFAFVGPHLPLDAHFAIGNFIRDALAGQPIHIGGDGTPVRSYLYAADLAIWLWTMLLRGEAGRIYNVGSPEEISIGDLARTVGELFHCPVTVATEPVSGTLPTRYVPDTRRAECELGLIRTSTLPDAIRKTAAWWQTEARL